MFTVYAIKSNSHNLIYVGMTENLEERLSRHNNGYVKSTKNFRPFTLIYQEQAADGTQARIREKFFKK
ncbi:MAG: GIY-YIG nuclease family protein [Ignavibacteriaceae bacterium]|nr:GIY-YIG nuclease family protein [Ignavibacteriaceae bacterium]